jgi:hypothetical protein
MPTNRVSDHAEDGSTRGIPGRYRGSAGTRPGRATTGGIVSAVPERTHHVPSSLDLSSSRPDVGTRPARRSGHRVRSRRPVRPSRPRDASAHRRCSPGLVRQLPPALRPPAHRGRRPGLVGLARLGHQPRTGCPFRTPQAYLSSPQKLRRQTASRQGWFPETRFHRRKVADRHCREGAGENGGGPRISIAPVAAAAARTRPKSGAGGGPAPAGSLATR